MVTIPLGLCRQFLEVLVFVAAFLVTVNMVGVLLVSQRPEWLKVLKEIVSRWRAVLLFSLTLMVAMGVLAGLLFLPASYLLKSAHLQQVAASRAFILSETLIFVTCLAWVLLPAAIRLARASGGPSASDQDRKIGVAYVVIASAIAFALEHAIGWAENAVVLHNNWEVALLSAVNSILESAPNILLFIALALLSLGRADSPKPSTDPDLDVLPPEPTPE
jgi:hypothetical protein